jgi:hypothetical protein
MAFARGVEAQLKMAGVRVHFDGREELTPGFKFNDWELRGVPVRVEIGPKDVANNAVVLARRDSSREIEAAGGPKAKQFGVPAEGAAAAVRALLGEIQVSLLAQATAFRDANTQHRHRILRPVPAGAGDGRRLPARPLGRHAARTRTGSKPTPRPRSAATPSTRPKARASASTRGSGRSGLRSLLGRISGNNDER